MKIIKICFIFSVCSLFLTGCFDKVEIEERAIVLAIGIDKYDKALDTSTEQTGEEKRFVVSLAMPEVSEEEKGGESEKAQPEATQEKGEKSVNEAIKVGEGSSVASVMDLIDTYMSKKLYYGHTKAVVLGKGILEDKVLLKEVLDALERNAEISRKIIVLGTNLQAKEILQTVPKDEKMLGIYINDFYKNDKKNTALTYNVDLEDVVQDLLSTGDTAIPDIEIVDEDVRLLGMIALKDSQYVGELDDAITKGLLWILDKKSLGEISVPFEDGYVSSRIFKKKLKKDIYEENGKIVCKFNIDVEGNISEYTLGENIIIGTEKYKTIETKIAEKIKEEVIASFEKIKSLDADIMGLKELIRKDNYDLYKKYDLENKDIYSCVEFKIETTAKIKGAGSVR